MELPIKAIYRWDKNQAKASTNQCSKNIKDNGKIINIMVRAVTKIVQLDNNIQENLNAANLMVKGI